MPAVGGTPTPGPEKVTVVHVSGSAGYGENSKNTSTSTRFSTYRWMVQGHDSKTDGGNMSELLHADSPLSGHRSVFCCIMK